MNYIGLLTKEEITILCKIITGKEFREIFKKNEREFLKIQKGFRAKSLTEQHALLIAISNVDKPFIAMRINTMVDNWIKEIQENIAKLEGDGLSHGAALATTMLDSFFVNNVDLYFKLTGNSLDQDMRSWLYERMEDIKSERASNAAMSDRIKALEEENRHMSEEVETAQRNVDAMKAEYEGKVQEIARDKERLRADLETARATIAELQVIPSAIMIDDADYLVQYDDTNTSALPSGGTNEIISLCEVTSDYSGQKWLIRYADLNNDGDYSIFRRNEYTSPTFTNRDRIYYKGSLSDGSYGVWNWSAVPNENDPSKDFVLSHYNTEIDVIEMVIVTQTTTLDSLVDLLKGGIECQLHSRKVMFLTYVSKGRFIGVLCTEKDLSALNGKIAISEKCSVVPVYEVASNYIIRLDNGLSFYRKAFAGIPSKLYHIKSPQDIVKDIVVSSLSWSAYKARGIIRAEYRTFKDFIEAMPVDDITRKIGVACRCSNLVATRMLEDFFKTVWNYVDGNSLEDEIICAAISVNTDLQAKVKALIRKDWEEENESLLAKVRQELDLLHGELKSATENLSKAQEALNQTKAEDERLSDIVTEKRKLAEDVEKTIADRIQKARENVAEFIADMAFVHGQRQDMGATAVNAISEQAHATYCTYKELENFADLEAHHAWADVIDTVEFELAEAGVAEKYQKGLAAFLCAAYIEKQPLFLVGPNAIDIIQAFSAAVTAQKYGILCCEGSYDRQRVAQIGADGEDIVIINNLLGSGWINRLPDIISKNDIFYVAIHPYIEDIQVEPKSLYEFMLPLVTEFLVDKRATGKYSGGYFSDDFIHYSAQKRTRQDVTSISKFSVSALVKNQINRLAATMHDIYPTVTTDEDFLFCIFPTAYASSAIDKLAEIIADPQRGVAISANLKRDLQYVLGEI